MNHTDLYHNKLAQLCVNLREQLIHVYANLYLTPPRSQVLASTARFSSFTASRSLCSCTRLVFSVVFNICTADAFETVRCIGRLSRHTQMIKM